MAEVTCKSDRRIPCGCAVKIPIQTVYSALHNLKPFFNDLGYCFAPRDDAYVSIGTELPLVERRIYDVQHIGKLQINDLNAMNPYAAITMISMIGDANLNSRFETVLQGFYSNLSKAKARPIIGKGHSIRASKTPDQEFISMDYLIKKESDADVKYIVANNDTMQLIDSTLEPADPLQIEIPLNNAINDILLMGAYENIRLYPLYDSTTPELKEEMKRNITNYAKKYGFELSADFEPLNKNMQLMGATVIGTTKAQPPHNQNLKTGDELWVTRNIGDLFGINAYIHNDSIDNGKYYDDLKELREEVLKLMATPNIGAAKVIQKYRPLIDEKYDSEHHLRATRDITGEGIGSLKELAEDSKVNIYLDNIPLHNESLMQQILKDNPIMPDGTAGTAGAIIIGGPSTVMDSVIRDLRLYGYAPQRVGNVTEGNGRVIVDKRLETLLNDLILDPVRRNNFEIAH